ncbi:sugar ABC transporter permease [Enterococcus cecorum]|uniref:carbohydrate ABC transporter permease n=2 Tax=Enterococcus cecorum TaxID=44008 RepID=UPI001D76E442|nr:sugar ABC transporter permease [Enterococcus cecorum]MCJ0575962.1 sugar ABC transporter permease [Enterococcus cecorum]MDZ5440932.1 sugar ABC transporter permease [Enterococcus cecorum]MDZ5498965.1 sugar ABC transporter permease [Enterococcus cecorum]MDZ5501051.1 sugar ABC transporter permease [Enterococcus cecorum]MDZ5505217.1 sugar ABC transporter permease [Enterococcus cecorum]
MSKKKIFFWMTFPFVLIFFMFHTFPLLTGVYYSLTNSKGFGNFEFVGLKNYIRLFSDEQVINSYLFTFKFAILTTILVNVIGLLLAVLLNSRIKFKTFFRGVYFSPYILGGLIVGYVFNYLFTFIVPALGRSIGSSVLSTSLLGTPNLAWIGIVITVAWQSIAFNTLIYISGIQTIPEDIYEAAKIDGSSSFQSFWKITFPLLAPFFTINLVLSMRNYLMVFDQIMSLTGGGPAQSTTSISMLIYKNGLSGNQFGYQSANAVIYFIVIVFVSIFQLKILNKREVQL